MSQHDENEDEQLLEELGRALQSLDPVPNSVLGAAKGAFLTRNLDRELAELVFDSATGREVVLARGDAVRTLSFRAGNLLIELEARRQEGLILGMLVPTRSATVELEVEGLVTASVPSDSFGRFRFEEVSPGPLTIVCRSSAPTPLVLCTVGFDF